jgi:thiol:disulfide interchange protein DsbA
MKGKTYQVEPHAGRLLMPCVAQSVSVHGRGKLLPAPHPTTSQAMPLMIQKLLVLFAFTGLCAAPVFAQAPTSDAFQAGVDYHVIDIAQSTASEDKIEVVEIFGYSCGACAVFQPLVNNWSGKLPADVSFGYIPAQFGGIWDDLARAYYTAESLNVLDKTHDALFNAVHVERKVLSASDIPGFYETHGVSAEAFEASMNSFAVKTKLARSKQQVPRYGVSVTPTLIVAGKYRVEAGNGVPHQRMLEVVDFLINKERAARAN